MIGHFVTSKINLISDESILFSTPDINIALHSLKCRKLCCVDGLAAEHFKYAHRISHVFLSLLFNSFISHGYFFFGEEDLFYTEKNKSTKKIHTYFAKSIYTYNQY